MELVSPPSRVVENELVDIQVRYRMTGSNGGPFLIEELSIRDSDPLGAFNRIARTDGQRFSSQGVWNYYTFRNVRLSDFDDGGNGVELYAYIDIDNQAPFYADATDSSPESQVRITPGVPDLVVTSLTVSDLTVKSGDKIDLHARVTNIGNGDASQTRIYYYLGQTRGSRSLEIGYGLMPNLGVLSPDETEGDTISNFAVPDWPDGKYYVTAVADENREVSEQDETNNELSVQITIGNPPNEPPAIVPVASLICGPATGPGVTIITHGFQLGGGASSQAPDWTVEMGEAILARSGEPGNLLVHDPDANRWVRPQDRDFETSWTNSGDLNNEIVLVFDWTWESNDLQEGWAEAAADSLFAALVSPFGLSAGQSQNLLTRPLHFIGHSRGTIVNSLVAQRIDYYFPDIIIDQFTTLDPHPSTTHKDPGYDADPRQLQIPDNIHWADNYFRQDGAYELDNDFDGVRVAGAANLELSESVLQGAGHLQEHSDVHLWYLATIDPTATTVEGDDLSGNGFDDWWTAGVGYSAAVEDASGRANVGYASSRIASGTRDYARMSRSLLIKSPKPANVFNGDFELGAELTNEIPGWERHGGGGSGNLDGAGNNYLLLNDNDDSRVHNALYIPPTASDIEFDYWITNSDGLNPNDRLEVLVNSQRLGSGILLAATTNGFVRGFRLPLSETQVGQVSQLEFRLGGSGDIQSSVRIDNVHFVEERSTRALDLDTLHAAVASGTVDRLYDLNHDLRINADDGTRFLQLCRVNQGDANRDGVFNTTDLVDVFKPARYETGQRATWSEGDWNFDGLFESGDLVAALQGGLYETDRRVAGRRADAALDKGLADFLPKTLQHKASNAAQSSRILTHDSSAFVA
ncbi:MAG: hypothetical protein KDB23_01875 [Planctomycetales bacterium]|nr:hypothetical protein [Planctomycetales bacterium]